MPIAPEHAFKEKSTNFIDPSTPRNCLQSHISMWYTLYYVGIVEFNPNINREVVYNNHFEVTICV